MLPHPNDAATTRLDFMVELSAAALFPSHEKCQASFPDARQCDRQQYNSVVNGDMATH